MCHYFFHVLHLYCKSIYNIKKDVSSIKTSSIVKKTEGVSFFTVSLSTIRENSYILSPEYYDTEKQLENICKEIDKKANLSAVINFLNKIAKEEKFNGIPMNKDLVRDLRNVLEKDHALHD